jgi:hypothetical protein
MCVTVFPESKIKYFVLIHARENETFIHQPNLSTVLKKNITLPRRRQGLKNSTMIYFIYFKNFYINHNVPPAQLKKKKLSKVGIVAHICNPSYLGNKNWEDHGLRPAWGK